MTIGRSQLRHGTALAAALALWGVPAHTQERAAEHPEARADPLADGFRNPPQPARPQVWWHWMSGNVTPEGARLDLEWLARVGIGGVHAFSGGQLEQPVVAEPLPFMSDGWRAIYRDAVRQARAAGMDVTIAGSPGWSQTGGPWVAPAQGMKKYTWTTLDVDGARPGPLRLPAPPGTTGIFMAVPPAAAQFGAGEAPPPPQARGDGPVIAFPAPTAERTSPRYASQAGPLPTLAGAPEDLSRSVTIPIATGSDTFIDIDMGRSVTARALTIAVSPLTGMEVLASDDGREFRSIRRIAQDAAERPAAQQTIALPPTRARVFRVRFDGSRPWRVLPDLPAFFPNPPAASELVLRQLRIETASRVDRFEAKAGFQSIVERDADAPADILRGIDPASVIDLTARMRPDGTLDWTPPKGRWTVVRFGWSLTGHTNGPAEPSATGLEVDKLDPHAVQSYVDGLFSLYRDKAGTPLGKDGIDGLLTDSWEAGVQNWTPAMLADFRRLRGYDPTPWLPTLAGYVVGDARRSDAFLFDFRRTLKDLVVDSHYKVLADAAHQQGMSYYTEAQGDTPRAIVDGLAAKARSDIPTGEFWYRPFATDPGQPSLVADLREAASAAHLYGKPLVAAEALTVAAGNDPWAFSPAMLKPVADEIFAHGVNRILIHDSHLQPFVDRKPGLMLGFFGQFFNRNDTWANRARPWVDYLARTSWMLQQGRFVADIAYFYGEEESLAQRFERRQETDVPAGYGYDYVNAEALLGRLFVRDGRLVTDTGMSYRLLYVPSDVTAMSPGVVRKLDELVRAGAVVVARKPERLLGLADAGSATDTIADRLWGRSDMSASASAQGRLYGTGSLVDALQAERIFPDVAAPTGTRLMMLHRQLPDADIFFVSNRSAEAISNQVSFRVSGRAADWWSAEAGTMRPLTYRADGVRTAVELPLEANEAGFVVFRRPAAGEGVTIPAPVPISAAPIEGPWRVRFEAGRGAPATAVFDRLTDWTANTDPGIRFFSGAAIYSRALRIGKRAPAGVRTVIDLGEVHDVATVSVNGREVATVWHAPYRIDVTGAVKPGENRIDVEVVNLWPNRLIGDKQPGAQPVTYAPQSPYRADGKLLPSGLIGPVRLMTVRGGDGAWRGRSLSRQ